MSTEQHIDPEVSEFRKTAEWDWVLVGGGDMLHAVGTLTNEAADDWLGDGSTVCGRKGIMLIPGICTRMGAPRCKRCCEKTGFPQGAGSPKNDDRCRPLVEKRLAELSPTPKADPEGQEYAYRVCLDENDDGISEFAPTTRLRAERLRERLGEDDKSWVERALLGDWERVG